MFKKKPKPKQQPNRGAKHVEEVLFHASAMALRALRALDHEVQVEGSEDVIAMRLENVLTPLSIIARNVGYVSESAQIASAGKDIKKELSSRYQLTPNARSGHEPGGLAGDQVLLQGLVEMAAESDELDRDSAEVTDEVIEVAGEYDVALQEALEELVKKYPPENGADAQDLWNAEAPYLVLMTLRGEGVGIWDGSWDEFYEETKPIEAFLKQKLGKFADSTGAGKLEEAFMNAAYGEKEDQDEEGDDDEDDEDDED